jgi:membrane protease YdiL (CAAX protease family)
MPILVSTIVSTLIQTGVVLLICALFYAFSRRQGFLAFVGLTRAPLGICLLGCLIGFAGAALLLSVDRVRAVAAGPGTVIASLTDAGLTPPVIAALALAAVVKTAFAEELLFRGLIARGLIRWLGFGFGNALQALIFGLVHLLLILVARPDPLVIGMLCLFAATLGWVNGWLKERRANGSILPGIAAHGCANLVTYLSIPLLFHGS